jgi:hypothetical protein
MVNKEDDELIARTEEVETPSIIGAISRSVLKSWPNVRQQRRFRNTYAVIAKYIRALRTVLIYLLRCEDNKF